MIPYFILPTVEVFGSTVSSFDIFVTIGLFFGFRSLLNYARRQNMSVQTCYDFSFVAIIAGFLGAHFFHGLFYEKPFSFANIFLTMKGLSSVGGFLGGWLGVHIFLKLKKLKPIDYADACVWSVLVGMFWGRLGCFSVHDHPGRFSSFLLAVDYPGGSRHDLGFYEMIFIALLILWIRFNVLHKKPKLFLSGLILSSYGLFRVIFDSLRDMASVHADARYWHFTPAQYVGVVFIILGVLCIQRMKSNQE